MKMKISKTRPPLNSNLAGKRGCEKQIGMVENKQKQEENSPSPPSPCNERAGVVVAT
jgi:hypothetical protein